MVSSSTSKVNYTNRNNILHLSWRQGLESLLANGMAPECPSYKAGYRLNDDFVRADDLALN